VAAKKLTEAAVKLAAYLFLLFTQSQLADALSVSPQAVWNWINGKSRPSRKAAEAIERVTGIPAKGWLSDEDVRAVEKAARKAKAS